MLNYEDFFVSAFMLFYSCFCRSVGSKKKHRVTLNTRVRGQELVRLQ